MTLEVMYDPSSLPRVIHETIGLGPYPLEPYGVTSG